MELQIIWFVLWSVLWAVYFMLDGFVFGTGMLHYYLGTTDQERKILINTVGPVWDGNEVWLVTAGGATFAAFPTTYALMFSYLYSALLLLLFSLIIRGVSLEFRGKLHGPSWKKIWDLGIFVGSALPALLFGVAFGNIFSGLPMDAAGYHGSLLSLLNPYGLVSGVVFVILFLVHGSLYAAVKTEGRVRERAIEVAEGVWAAELLITSAFLIATVISTNLYENYRSLPLLMVVPALAVVSLVMIKIFLSAGKALSAFASSCVLIVLIISTGLIGLFPNLIPSSTNALYSLTIYNSSSSAYTLKIMTVVALVFVPIVIAYKIWVYRVFRSRVTADEVMKNEEAY
ncbi:MAG TPA: cytochrome d ubiquinol oxidase subunit II [Nitrospirota bacterium]|nr:cytochrome d ubiquinol oxidase subunit II [Nitrospirota bacterium]